MNKIKKKNLTRFRFSMPIMKAYVEKNEEGVEKRMLRGVASTTDKDLHGEKMDASAIKSMAKSIKELKKKDGSLNAEHNTNWDSDLGRISELSVDKKNRLIMEAELNKTSKSNDLWYLLTEKKKKLGLSVAGFVKRYRNEIDEKTGRFMRIFEDVVLDHVGVVTDPANPKTWLSAISKSVNGVSGNLQLKVLDNQLKVDGMKKKLKTTDKQEKDLEKKSTSKLKSGVEKSEDTSKNIDKAKVEKKVEKKVISKSKEVEEDKTKTKDKVIGKKFVSKKEFKVLQDEMNSGFDKILEKISDISKASKKKVEKKVSKKVEKSEEVDKAKKLDVGIIQKMSAQIEELNKKVSNRKTVSLEKFEEEDNPKTSLSKALKDARKKYEGDPNLFSILGQIRREYKDI